MNYDFFRTDLESEEAAEACLSFFNRASLSVLDNYIGDLLRDGTIVEIAFKPAAPESVVDRFEQFVSGFNYGFREGAKR